MDIMSLIPRRLDADSCWTVGVQIQSEIRDWKNDHHQTSLPETLERKSQELWQTSEEIDQLEKEGLKIGTIDRIVDSILSAWDKLPDLAQKILQDSEELPFLDTEKVYLEALEKIKKLSLPEGVEIIRLPFRRQWRAMQKAKKALLSLDAELALTGLSVPAAHIIRWIDHYGARLGITEANDEITDRMAAAVEKWHQILAEIFYTLIQYNMEPGHKDLVNFPGIDLKEVRELFTVPYELQAEVERQEVREARERRKKKLEEERKKREEEEKKREEEEKAKKEEEKNQNS